ncbi:ELM1/GtrOC1 family putative glycosyltransferase [Congregibacter variabilis]|uniref:ELM1/GtrOC1 family putative glycosyltransferase n=1 Tax=Congregibacter variabilis TaxID=3081200 RepID=A0ABZ0I113_9GAMM|nr:ELM1/GtrOC1 family putative glycosyltransferase [Congregibacter sp. IMCC43200]
MQGTIGVVSDGKPGHLNQSLGLADALQRLRPELEVQEIPAMPVHQAFGKWLWPGKGQQNMRLLIGAGHGTHLSLLALRRAYCCPAIVLMRPSLPGAFFDLRIEPRHDGGIESERCWISEGPLNRMQPAGSRSNDGLILIGGPSPHFAWDGEALLVQIQCLCDGHRQWQLSGSRRTPPEFLQALANLDVPGLTVHDAASLPAAWLATQLPRCASCWVTPDSASMVYEALTAGCAVGVFDLPAQAGSRVATAIEGLCARRMIMPFDAFATGTEPSAPDVAFAEADRCAQRIIERGWL